MPTLQYERRRPEQTPLYQVVAENLETLYGAIDDGGLPFRLTKYARKELEGYQDCGLLCRGFARMRCDGCNSSHLVAFSCGGRGFCPSCLGRRMCATAANLIDYVLPEVDLRQWVLTFPFSWRKRLACDGHLLSALSRIATQTILEFYTQRAEHDGKPQSVAMPSSRGPSAQGGAVVVMQRTSSDMRLNPHLHMVLLDGAYCEVGSEVVFHGLGHLQTRQVGEVLERAVKRMVKYLRRRGLLGREGEGPQEDEGAEGGELEASAVSGQAPPAGPQFQRKVAPLLGSPLACDKPLCASLDGFALHAATRAGGLAARSREALVRCVLRPPLAQDAVQNGRAWCASCLNAPSATAPKPSTWIRSRFSAGSLRPSLHRDFIP